MLLCAGIKMVLKLERIVRETITGKLTEEQMKNSTKNLIKFQPKQ